MAFSRIFLSSFLLLLFLNPGIPLPAQTGKISSLAAEIGKAENLPRNPGEKYQALLRLARLLQLSGDPERAAAVWLEAANTAPGGRDDRALLEGCRILIALGEYERAEEGIRAALTGGREKPRAEYLAALAGAFRSGDDSALVRMAGEADFAPCRSEIYYTLWKISGGAQWKTRLLEEFPQSPEGMIAREAGGVSPAATAHWILFPGRESVSVLPAAPAPQEAAASRPAASSPASPAATPVPAPAAQAPAVSAGASGAFLQAGLYGKEENALSMVEGLKKAGFDASLRRRTVNGTGYWAVSVPPGPDMNRTIRRLKEASFDSFPVYE
jgi:tetratricopeptide (TPR) repeat protein